MDDEVERPPFLPQCVEDRIDRAAVRDIAGENELGTDLGGERLDTLFEGVALIGEGERGAVRGGALGDAPGDGPVVGDAHDQAPLAAHQLPMFGHPFLQRLGLRASYTKDVWRPAVYSAASGTAELPLLSLSAAFSVSSENCSIIQGLRRH